MQNIRVGPYLKSCKNTHKLEWSRIEKAAKMLVILFFSCIDHPILLQIQKLQVPFISIFGTTFPSLFNKDFLREAPQEFNFKN